MNFAIKLFKAERIVRDILTYAIAVCGEQTDILQ